MELFMTRTATALRAVSNTSPLGCPRRCFPVRGPRTRRGPRILTRAEPDDSAGASSAAEPSTPSAAAKGVDSGAQGSLSKEWVEEVVSELKDTSKLGSRGEAWFAAQLVALLLVAFPPGPLRPLVDAAGWLLVAGGLGLVVAGQQSLGQNLTPLPTPRESGQLVTSGIYGYCRHPMYGGLVVAAVGLTLATGDEVRLLMTLVLAIVLSEKASFEERLLEAKHPEYTEYKRCTKKLVPYIF